MTPASAGPPPTRRGDSTRITLLGRARGVYAWTTGWKGGLALVLLCLCVLLPGLFVLPPIDRDESRFAQASRQMWTTGDWVVPMVQDRPRLNKPPLTYWLQGTTAKLLSAGDPQHDAIWMYRLPGAMAMLLSALLTWRLGLRLLDPRAAWLGAALLALSPLVIFDAHQARSDQLLLASAVATQFALWRTLQATTTRSRWLWTLATGLACGVGLLAKGPITPMIALLTIVGYAICRRGGRNAEMPKHGALPWSFAGAIAYLFIGLALAALCVVPWGVMVGTRVGWEKYLAILHDEVLGRSVEPKEGHAGPPGYHLVLLVGLFFPGSLLAGAAVIAALREGLRRGVRWAARPATLFLLAWLLPTWLVFELIGTKLPHYVMPLYPALALLTARATLRASAGLFPAAYAMLARVGYVVWGVVGIALLACTPVGVIYWHNMPAVATSIKILTILVALSACVLIAWATLAACTRRPLRALLLSATASALSIGVTLQVLLPACERFWVPTRITDHARAIDPGHTRPLGAFGYQEDSLIFLTHGKLVRVADADRDAWLARHAVEDPLVVLPEDQLASLPQLRALATEAGFNYSRGKPVRIVLAELIAPPSRGSAP